MVEVGDACQARTRVVPVSIAARRFPEGKRGAGGRVGEAVPLYIRPPMHTLDEQLLAFGSRTAMLRAIPDGPPSGLFADAWEGALVILPHLYADDDVIAQIKAISGQDVRACYQCGKCTAGCPLASAMDLMPNQILRVLQLGEHEQALQSRTIWQCASCLTCAARCPKDVDPARVMDALRTLLMRGGLVHVEIPKIPAALLAEAPQQALIGGFRKFVGY